jgi:rhodanese-related sulfurtransferase
MWRSFYAGAMSPESVTYAGDVAPEEAYAALAAEEDAVLVDVRTAAEWTYVGSPDLTALGKRVVHVEWQRFPDGAVNGDFVEQLRDAGLPDGAPIYFICRSGVRSVAAAEAATRAGLEPSYNVLEGFEGPHDEQGHRAVSGWKNSGLPWRQG